MAQAQLIGTHSWTDPDPLFGGLSGIEVSEDGSRFIAISDRAAFVTGRIDRENGLIVGVTRDDIQEMLAPDGVPLTPEETDSEGLAMTVDGLIAVSFEGVAGVRTFALIDAAPSVLQFAEAFEAMQDNAALEALAVGPDGALFAIPERSGRADWAFPVFRLKDGQWDQPFAIQRRGAFLVAGADFGTDGKLYILERDFVGVGFRTRVRRFDLFSGAEELVLQTGLRVHGNLEGISVWHDGMTIRLTMVADDNFNAFQHTQIVEYRLIN